MFVCLRTASPAYPLRHPRKKVKVARSNSDDELLAFHFVDDTTLTAIEEKLKLVTKIRESLETLYGTEYGNVLKDFLPVFMKILTMVPKQNVDNPQNKLRTSVLDVTTVRQSFHLPNHSR